MRKSFVSLISNDRFQLGCTGQTVYVLDAAGNELAKFRDMTYAYYPALHPDGEVAAVSSNTGIMAVYSLSELRLITKFRVSAAEAAQTDSIPCFSPDGKYLYHIEGRKGDSLNSRLTIYSTTDYQPVARLFEQGQKIMLSCIEIDQDGCVYLLGYFRKEKRNEFFVAKLMEQALQEVRPLDMDTYDFYESAVFLKQQGFTETAFRWSQFAFAPRTKVDLERMLGEPVDMGLLNREYTLDDLRQMNPSLARCWEGNG